MPGMIDTHRHMWQTAMRGYGADWTLTQYFVWYYLEHGKTFRPQDIHAGNLLAGIESLDAGVTTTVDWSHGLQTTEHADAAVDALSSVPGRFVLAYGNIQAGPWEWSTRAGVPRLRQPADHPRRRHARLPDGLRRHRRPDVPGEGRVRGGPRPRRPGDHARRRLGRDQRRRHPADATTTASPPRRTSTCTRPRSPRTPTSGSRPPAARCRSSTESEQSCGQGYPPTWTLRSHDIPVSLSMDTSVWWSGDLFSAMRTTLGADRSREHLEAHAKGDTVTNCHLRADQVVEWATRGGAKALGLDGVVGQLEAGQEGRRRADQERPLAGDVPAAQPVRARGLPGPARGRAHGRGQRPDREARARAGRHRPARGAGRGGSTVEYLRARSATRRGRRG